MISRQKCQVLSGSSGRPHSPQTQLLALHTLPVKDCGGEKFGWPPGTSRATLSRRANFGCSLEMSTGAIGDRPIDGGTIFWTMRPR
jgi:hypothetical protein